MGPFVLDASMTLSWCFASEASERGDAILSALRKSYAVVPSLWPFEIASSLLIAERRQRITGTESEQFVHQLRHLQIHIERRESLWLWQANLPLATLDANLHQAALALQIPVLV